MRAIVASLLMLAAFALLLGGSLAGEKGAAGGKDGKEVKLTGKITCAKCDLGKESKCATVIVTKKDGKETVYYFDTPSHKKNHGAICTTPKDGTVTGTVSKEGDKRVVTVKKVEFKD